jgi:hypothetical protein
MFISPCRQYFHRMGALKVAIRPWIVSGIPAPPVTIQCSEETERDLLRIAALHCQSAVQKIEQALTPSP